MACERFWKSSFGTQESFPDIGEYRSVPPAITTSDDTVGDKETTAASENAGQPEERSEAIPIFPFPLAHLKYMRGNLVSQRLGPQEMALCKVRQRAYW